MSFSVDPDLLHAWASRTTALASDADLASRYADGHLRFGDWPGVFAVAAGIMEEARSSVVASSTAMGELLTGSGNELARTSANYREVDVAESARLDALYPTGQAPAQHTTASATPTAARDDPASLLTPPVATQPVPDVIGILFSLPDLVSPAYYSLLMFDLVFGFNPLTEAGSFVAGEWNQFAVAADALDKLADFDAALASSIGSDHDSVLGGRTPGWTGEAADAASAYFTRLRIAVGRQAVACRDMGRECRSLASGMFLLAKGVEDGLKSILDWALLWGISVAASAVATSTTVVGGVFGAAAATYAAVMALAAWRRVTESIGLMFALANGFVGAMSGFMAPLRDVRTHPLPAGAYDHPGV